MAQATLGRYMPPWKPDAPSGTFVGERRLTEEEIALLARWAKAGAPEGDRAALPPAPHWSEWQLGTPDLIVTLPEYTLRPEGLDVFRNFVVAIPGRGVRYVRGLEFRSGSPAVHHANIRIDYTATGERMDEADPRPGYEGVIPRTADYPDGHFLGWTPGQVPPVAPKGLAWRLDEQARFVVQLHMRPTGKPEPVRPAIGLFFTNDAPTQSPAMLRLGRQNIDIPAGEARYRSVDEYVVPVDVQVNALQPHSHYRAVEVRTSRAARRHDAPAILDPAVGLRVAGRLSPGSAVLAPGGYTDQNEVRVRQLRREPAQPRDSAAARALGLSSHPTKWPTSGSGDDPQRDRSAAARDEISGRKAAAEEGNRLRDANSPHAPGQMRQCTTMRRCL